MKRNQMLGLLPFCLIVLTAGVQVAAQDVSQQFRNPAKAYRPMVRWWWPGDDVQDAELRREVDLLDRDNFGELRYRPSTMG